MTALPHPRVLSETVAAPLRRIARRRWRLVAGTGLLQLLIVCLTVWLAAALLAGSHPNWPRAARLALSAVAWISLFASLVVFLRPALARRSLAGVARQVETDLGDSRELLSSAVELSAERDPRYAGSDELVAHVIRQAEEAARAVRPEAIVPLKGLTRWATCLFPVLLCWAVLMPAMPQPMLRGLYALLMPWRDALPSNLAAVTVTPGDVTIADGDPLQITATIGPRLRSKPNVNAAALVTRFATGQTQSSDMTRAGPRAFSTSMDRVVAGFSYRVVSEDGSSPWHTVKVMPRPALASIDVRYTYPAYTKLPPKAEPRKDGSIDALVGTAAQVSIRSTQPLAGKSRLVIGEKNADEQSVPLVDRGNGEYVAQHTVAKSGQYRIDLVNAEGLSSRDDLVRPITARPDKPPIATITSPAQKVSAPPDDTVPVVYKASDDFGLAKLEMIVQIDGQPPETIAMPLAADANAASGQWSLDIPQQLAKRNLHDASRIEYQLKATDNRDPNPQFGFSAKQVIEIDHAFKETFAARRDAEAARNLTDAIKRAIKELGDEQAQLDPLVKVGADRVFSAAMKRSAGAAKDAVAKTATDLAAAAKAATEENANGPLADAARAAQAVADDPIKSAAEDAAAAVLSADQAEPRQKDLAAADAKLDQARRSLEALQEQLKAVSKQQELARALSDMAGHEREIARDLAKPEKQQDRNQDMQRQQALRQRLEELLNQNKDLDAPAAREAAQRNEQLVRRIEQLAEQQKRLDGLAEKQQAVQDAQAPLNKLAEQQKELNKAIGAFAGKEQPELKDAGARAPADQKLENIVQALQRPERANEANQQQREAANELRQAAQQLANAARSDNAPPGQRQRQDRQDADRAKAAAREAKEVAKQLEAAKDAKDRDAAKEQVKQREQQLAQKLEQQANEMAARDPGQKEGIEAAKKEIGEAKQSAQDGDAAKADAQLAGAADKLEQAANADAAAAKGEQQEMAAAAKQAEALGQRQQQLADQSGKAAQAVAQARQQQGDAQQLERGQQQAAQQAGQVANEAGQAEQQDRAQGEAGMARRAEAAKQAIGEAAAHEQAAAKAAQGNQPARAAAEQKAAEQSLARAEQAARGLPEQTAAGDDAGKGEGSPPGQSSSPADLTKQAAASAQEARQAQEEAMSGRARAAAEAARALEQAAGAISAAARQQAAQVAANNLPARPPAPPGQAKGSERGQDRGSQPGQATDPKGIDITGIARADGRPPSVKEVGISASDWARLPPLVQQQLLNAAQQSGPPGYQEMIKNYFVRIAKIEAEDGEGK